MKVVFLITKRLITPIVTIGDVYHHIYPGLITQYIEIFEKYNIGMDEYLDVEYLFFADEINDIVKSQCEDYLAIARQASHKKFSSITLRCLK